MATQPPSQNLLFKRGAAGKFILMLPDGTPLANQKKTELMASGSGLQELVVTFICDGTSVRVIGDQEEVQDGGEPSDP